MGAQRVLRAAVLGILVAAMASLGAGGPGRAAEPGATPIRIGDLNSYTRLPAFTIPYRHGWEMGVAEINAAGGVLGRPIEVVSRDDGGRPGDAITVANELVSREGVVLLFGTLLSNVGLAVADFAHQRKVVFLAAEPLTDALAWEKGNAHTFRLRPGTYVQAAMLAEEAAKLPARRWATVAPNYEYGQSAVAAFKQLLSARRPDVEFVEEQWPALFKIDAGTTVQALARSQPEAIFNVTFGSDLAQFVREGRIRGLFEGRPVVSMLSGEPEWIDPVGSEAPEGWIVTGYPWYAIETPEHTAFRDAYMERFDEYPRMGSVVGYASILSIAAAIEKAGTLETAAIREAFRGLEVETPLGPTLFRESDQQTTLGTFVGTLTVEDGMPRMVDWRYVDGANYLPSEEAAAAMRPGG
jgi:branched-chain amino acid transport system substrate-binding protein